MKKIKVLVIVAIIAFSNFANASSNPEADRVDGPAITKEVSDLLKNPTFEVKEEVMALVTVILNKDNEIVVLSVDTKNEVMESFIKSRLNYKTLSKNSTSGIQSTFSFPVRFTTNTI